MALLIPEYLQTKKYAAGRARGLMMDMPFQPGVVGAGSMQVTQRAAGANKSVDIAAGPAWVKGASSARQGYYHIYNDAVVNLTIPDNTSGNPRIDRIVATVNDTTDGGAVADNVVYQVLAGTPTAGATVDNLSGAVGTFPPSSLQLAVISVASGFTSITNSVIRDRRAWAHGLYSRNAYSGADGTAGATTVTSGLFAADTSRRVEVGANASMLRIRVSGVIELALSTTYTFVLSPIIDGSVPSGYEKWFGVLSSATTGSTRRPVDALWDIPVAAGSHFVEVGARNTPTATTTIKGNPSWVVTYEEVLRPDANNGTS